MNEVQLKVAEQLGLMMIAAIERDVAMARMAAELQALKAKRTQPKRKPAAAKPSKA